MFVQRLTTWLSRLAAAVSPRARQHADHPPERQVVLTHAMGYDHEERSFAAGGSTLSGGWLDDARRLRPHIPRAPLQAPRWSGKSALSGPSASSSSDGSRPARASERPGKALSSGMSPMQPPRPEPAARTQPLPPVPGVPSLPGVPASPRDDTTATPNLDQHLQRRLRSLRFLVRHGVYNEGFPDGQAPEQYHFSLGLGPQDSE